MQKCNKWLARFPLTISNNLILRECQVYIGKKETKNSDVSSVTGSGSKKYKVLPSHHITPSHPS